MKLIDGDELMKEFDRRRYHEPDFDLTDAEWLINDAEEIEGAVVVVRCKDCKHRDADDFCTGRGYPNALVPDDGFCDKGERRNDAV